MYWSYFFFGGGGGSLNSPRFRSKHKFNNSHSLLSLNRVESGGLTLGGK